MGDRSDMRVLATFVSDADSASLILGHQPRLTEGLRALADKKGASIVSSVEVSESPSETEVRQGLSKARRNLAWVRSIQATAIDADHLAVLNGYEIELQALIDSERTMVTETWHETAKRRIAKL